MKPLTRREFLKLSSLSLGAGLLPGRFSAPPFPPEDSIEIPLGYGRVASDEVSIHRHATFRSEKLGRYRKDTLIGLLATVRGPDGPAYNPHWYRTEAGFVHSGRIQRFENRLNSPVETLPAGGQLGEVTVAYSQSLRYFRVTGWEPLYRLYYRTVHWITAIVEGPTEGRWGRTPQPWYEITDERLRARHIVPAAHIRLIPPEEVSPLSAHVPADEKSILVSIENQTLTAFEGDQPVFHTLVSTGVHTEGASPNGIPTDTPLGRFYIGNKMPSRHMGNGVLTDDIYAYELPGVPWNCFFVATGVAFHGAYWHTNFGYRMSAGCVNLRVADAKWLYRWTTPAMQPDEWYRYERGTRVDVVI